MKLGLHRKGRWKWRGKGGLRKVERKGGEGQGKVEVKRRGGRQPPDIGFA